MTDTEITIALDQKTIAIRSGGRWAIRRKKSDGTYDTEKTWAGNRRSLLTWCEDNGVHPSRDAEERLAMLPESNGFRER